MANEQKKQSIASKLLDKASSYVATKLPMYKQAKEDEKTADREMERAKNERTNKQLKGIIDYSKSGNKAKPIPGGDATKGSIPPGY